MPRARNIKPGFFKNEDLPEIDPLGRLLFIGLWTLADRSGRMEYRPKKIKAELFPYEDCDVQRYCKELESLGFVKIYEISGTQYLQILTFEKHQKPHPNEKEFGYPPPDNFTSNREKVVSNQAECGMMNDDCLNDDSLKKEQPDAGAASNGHDDDSVFLALPCLKNKTYPITESLVAEYEGDFPAVDVRQELRNAVAWIKANPKKKKTHSGARRFLTGWLTRSQNRGGNKPSKDSEEELWKREAWK